MTKTELYEKIIEACGGDPNALPDKLETTELACILGCLGGNLEELEGKLCGDLLEAIAGACPTGGGGSGDGVTIRNQNKTITQNGSYKADSGFTGLGTVTVNVPQEDPVLQDKTVTQNGKYTADTGFDGLGAVTVAVPEPVLQDKTVTENGEYTADAGYTGLGKVTVNVEASGGGEDTLNLQLDDNLSEVHITSKNVPSYAFYQRVNVETVSGEFVETIHSQSFDGCTKLKSVNLPIAQIDRNKNGAFQNCTMLENVHMPGLTLSIGGTSIFSGCASLQSVQFPKLDKITATCFRDCANLKCMDAGLTRLIQANAFLRDVAFTCLILRKTDEIATLENTSAFSDTPFASGGTGGTVYCPAALITQYQQATNWATLYAAGTCNFVAIEGSEYE